MILMLHLPEPYSICSCNNQLSELSRKGICMKLSSFSSFGLVALCGSGRSEAFKKDNMLRDKRTRGTDHGIRTLQNAVLNSYRHQAVYQTKCA